MPEQESAASSLVTTAFYDRLASVYDRLFAYGPEQSGLQARWIKRVCPAGQLLDLGCGTGRMLGRLRQAGFSPVGLDCSGGMLAQARASHPDAWLVRADAAQTLPFATQSFTSIISLHASLIHITHPDARNRLAAEVLRLLKPGGVLVAELPHPRSYPPCGTMGQWRSFLPGVSCRRLDSGIEELRMDEMGGLTCQVVLLDLPDLRQWLAGFAKVLIHPGFQGGRFDPTEGRAMVVCAYK